MPSGSTRRLCCQLSSGRWRRPVALRSRPLGASLSISCSSSPRRSSGGLPGMVDVADLAASAAAVGAGGAITATVAADKVGYQSLQASGVILHPAEFDRDVAALDIAGFLQSGDEARRERCLFDRLWNGTGIQSKNHDKVCVLQKNRWLVRTRIWRLRARREGCSSPDRAYRRRSSSPANGDAGLSSNAHLSTASFSPHLDFGWQSDRRNFIRNT